MQFNILIHPGTSHENQPLQSLIVEVARDPQRAYLFNLASMAFNNHFFFLGLNTDSTITSSPSAELLPEINTHFSSLETLRDTFLATAQAMFGPGFVWLVQQNDSSQMPLRILTTYLAGSPLSGAHYRRQGHDLNTQNADTFQALNKVGAFGASAKLEQRPKKPLGGVDVVPLLCVSTWEHTWLHDHGVRGKSAFLEAWWDKINWDRVQKSVSLPQARERAFQGMRSFQYA